MKTYNQFIFKNYTFDAARKELKLYYSIDEELNFCETYVFHINEIANDNPLAQKRAFELLFLMAGVSYYKTFLPPQIVINNIELDKTTASFLQKTWQKGLGEFFYINNLDPLTDIKFPHNTDAVDQSEFNNNFGKLLAIGGGKDSLLSLEMLRASSPTTWACNHAKKLQPLVDKLGTKHISVSRAWDPQLGDLNTSGAYNGHVPISAIFACVGLVLASLTGNQDIVVSNESSANSPTLQYMGQDINHQYSKTLEFEADFQSILAHLFNSSKRYYSLLRPFTELSIAERFAPYFDKYLDVFCSCNKAFVMTSTNMQWCGQCPKCAFSYLIFAPFVPQKQLNTLFAGNNLLNEPSLQKTYEELLGISGVKPLECVGEVEECQIAYSMAVQKGLVDKPLSHSEPTNYNYKNQRAHLIPKDITIL